MFCENRLLSLKRVYAAKNDGVGAKVAQRAAQKRKEKKATDAVGVGFVALSAAAVKVLRLLPQELLDSSLPALLTKLSVRLRDRDIDVREATRRALAAVCVELGARHMPPVVAQLRSTLTRGYQLHVLGFTLHYVLRKVATTATPGEIDACVAPITAVCFSFFF